MRVGIVGCGGMGNVHASKYRQMGGIELHAFDADPAKSGHFVASHNAVAAESLESLIATCDALDVCVPTHIHFEIASLCLDAGKPTLVEKPMARTNEQCDELVRKARTSGTLLMPAQVVRWFPEFRKAHHLVKSGTLGDVASVRMRRGGLPPRGGPWFLDIEKSGGIILDLAVHEFDWLLWTLGPVSNVMARSAQISCGNAPAPAQGVHGDYALTTLGFKCGAVAHVESTWMDPGGFRVSYDIAGSTGTLEYDSRQNPTLRVASEGSTKSENNYVPGDDPYFNQLVEFASAARGESPAPVRPEEGASAVKVALAALESAASGKVVRLDDDSSETV